LAGAGFDTIIDVRAPSEFAEDHLPGAINLPVLSDDERAQVGTIYVQDSPFKARKLGAALVARNAARHLEGPLAEMDGGWKPLLYCWRGGQRSGSFASILSQIGWRVDVLNGGYQSYRRMVVDCLYHTRFPAPVVLLDGNTGTGKTEILSRLPAIGVQSIDLEGMANHRGSALGGRGDQPSQKGFETQLAAAIVQLDPNRPVVIEAESSRIGQLNLPPKLFEAMKNAPRIGIDAPVPARARYLCGAYKDVTTDLGLLGMRLTYLTKLQGHERVHAWRNLAQRGDFLLLAEELIRHHYDPRYEKLRKDRTAPVASVHADKLDDKGIARAAEEIAQIVKAL
jgi:tRNA 2-selenouridine synthase